MVASHEQPPTLEQRLAQLEELVTRQQEELGAQRDAISAQRAELARWHTSPVQAHSAGAAAREDASQRTARVPCRRTRRALLQLGGAAAAAGVAAVVAADGTAQARANASAVFTASGAGAVACEGDGASGAIGVKGSSDSSTGVVGTSSDGAGVAGTSSSNDGVNGQSTSGSGVFGQSSSSAGVFGQSSSNAGVAGFSSLSYGGSFSGGQAPLWLQASKGAGAGAPSTGLHQAGELYVDGGGILWYCTASGTPGIWVRMTGVASGTTGGALNYLAGPIRIYDSRAGQPAPLPVTKAPLAGGSTTSIQVTGTSVGGLSVPAGATGFFGNLTVTDTQGGGDLTLWPHGAPQPLTSNINYVGGQTVANAVNVGLSADGKLDLFVHVNGTDVILDVAGFVM